MGRRRGEGKTDLTARQLELLQMAADGLSHKEIAQQLGISEATVKNHFVDIYERLGATGVANAVAIGLTRGLLSFKEKEHEETSDGGAEIL